MLKCQTDLMLKWWQFLACGRPRHGRTAFCKAAHALLRVVSK